MYLSTPIYYVNGDPHLGHAHTSVMADIIARYWRTRGLQGTWLSTGVDEHGQKNEECARAAGMEPQAYLDQQATIFQALFDRLGVQYDFFVRTTEPYHKEIVTAALEDLQEQFVKRDYTGLYCVGCEQFKKETDLTPTGECSDHLCKPEVRTESNWFFPLEPYRQRVLDHLNSNPAWITPEQYANEVRNMLERPLEDLCISRPKTRLQLGIELPFDKDYVTYVWFDALLNYLSNIMWPIEHEERWKHANHLIGKDIVKTHCIYWPCMLLALGVSLPERIQVHAHWLGKGKVKMSKSLGNVVDPNDVMDDFGVDALRYFLARRMSTTQDTEITKEAIKDVYNTELANGVGNLLSRITKLYASSVGPVENLDHRPDEILYEVRECLRTEINTMNDIPVYMEEIAKAVSLLDQYFSGQAPWKLAKEGNIKDAKRVLRTSVSCIKMILQRLVPVLPDAATTGLRLLGVEQNGKIPDGHVFNVGEGLFKRIV
jgi:methionyl-tRNA synthetase